MKSPVILPQNSTIMPTVRLCYAFPDSSHFFVDFHDHRSVLVIQSLVVCAQNKLVVECAHRKHDTELFCGVKRQRQVLDSDGELTLRAEISTEHILSSSSN